MLYFLLDLFKLISRIIYAALKLLPLQDKVVLISRKTRKPSIDFRLLKQEIHNRSPETQVVILNHRMNNKFQHALDVVQEMYHLATARASIIDSYVIAVSILDHRPELVVVQIWHALGAIKEFGYTVIGRREGSSQKIADTMHMHRGYTYVVAGGEATVPIYAQAFNVDPSIIKPLGMPRVDYLLDKSRQRKYRQKIERKYPQIKDKKVIFYAPTFRKRTRISPQPLIDSINYDKYVLILKQHDHDKTHIKKDKHIINDKAFSALQLLMVADYVVTDYSAVAFEAAVLDKPLFFWVYDIEKYRRRRGLALDYESEMPGVISSDPKRIVAAIEKEEYNLANLKKFKQEYVSVRDGTSTSKIIDLLPI